MLPVHQEILKTEEGACSLHLWETLHIQVYLECLPLFENRLENT